MCDSMCVVGPEGTIFAKASDRPIGEVQLLEALPARAGGGLLDTQYLTIPDTGARPMLGGRPDWLWGLELGVNDAGVAMGNERLVTTRDAEATTPGLLGMDLVRLCLERASSADGALDVLAAALAEHGQGGIGDRARGISYYSSFLIADARGGWVVETCGRSWWASPVSGRAAISNRISLRAGDVVRRSPDLEDGVDPQRWLVHDVVERHADRRLACTLHAMGTAAEPADLVAVLRDHGTGAWGRPGVPMDERGVVPPPTNFDEDTAEGISVCMHLHGQVATTAALVVDLPADDRPVRAWVAPGSPCVSVFVPVRPTTVPAELGSPELWLRFAELIRRVESDVDALAEVRSVTGPLEAALWAEADELAGAAAWGRFAARVGPRLEAALRSLGV